MGIYVIEVCITQESVSLKLWPAIHHQNHLAAAQCCRTSRKARTVAKAQYTSGSHTQVPAITDMLQGAVKVCMLWDQMGH